MSALNAALAYRALDHIEANPDAYDRLVWIAQGHGLIVADFAGRVCLLAGDQPQFVTGVYETSAVRTTSGAILRVQRRAADLLGFDTLPIDLHGGDDLAELRASVAEIFGPRPAGEPS